MSLRLRPLGPALGALAEGLDLSQPLSGPVADALRRALAERLVLLFRGQDLEPERQIAFTRLFGPVEPHPLPTHRDPEHPELLVLRNEPGHAGRRNDVWHTDITFAAAPPAVSVLQAMCVPPVGGDTMFSNLEAVFASFSPGFRRFLTGLRAEHSGETEARTRGAGNGGAGDRTAVHPVVRRHPATGAPCLFTNPYFTTRFAGMTVEESRRLIDYLADAATRPEHVYRHRWQAGDVLVWDNRATMHYAVHDYDETMPRLMRRTTAGGAPPEAWRDA